MCVCVCAAQLRSLEADVERVGAHGEPHQRVQRHDGLRAFILHVLRVVVGAVGAGGQGGGRGGAGTRAEECARGKKVAHCVGEILHS